MENFKVKDSLEGTYLYLCRKHPKDNLLVDLTGTPDTVLLSLPTTTVLLSLSTTNATTTFYVDPDLLSVLSPLQHRIQPPFIVQFSYDGFE